LLLLLEHLRALTLPLEDPLNSSRSVNDECIPPMQSLPGPPEEIPMLNIGHRKRLMCREFDSNHKIGSTLTFKHRV
jgi:hypothetical protein